MNQKFIAIPAIAGWDDKWLAIGDKTDVANKALIENAVDLFGFVRAAFWQTAQRCAWSLRDGHMFEFR
jgi:hypothetical protein